MSYKTEVDQKRCSGCEECLQVCSAGVLEMRAGKAFAAHPEACLGCESCIEVCKDDAIRVEDTRVQLSGTCLSLLKDIL